MMLSKVQVVHLFVLPYSVQCSLSHCQMTETIADLTLAKDHTQQRSQCFCPWIYLVGGMGNLSQKILWHFPQFKGPELDHQNLIWLKEGWETKALMLGASRVRDRLWWTMNVYVKERGSVCAWQCWGGRPQTVELALGKQSAVSTISKCYHPYLTGVRTDSKKLKLTHRYFIGKGQCRA